MQDIFKDFRLARFNLTITAKENLRLPEYKGSTFRGGFGVVFKKICCTRTQTICNDCPLKDKCVYSLIFESAPEKHSEKLKNIEEIPRPFIIEPPLETKTEYRPGEELLFGLTLIGKAIDYLPYVIYAFIELGKIGIGKNKGKFELKKVTNQNNQEIYDGILGIFKNEDSFVKIELPDFEDNKDTLGLSFITPARIKYNGHYIDNPEFHIIIRALLRRISILMYFYCSKELEADFKNLISCAEKVMIKSSNIQWIDWERYSSRQDTRMKLGGLAGEVFYEGDFKPFSSFLRLGEYVHIGKNCTFGLGKYKILTTGAKNA